MNSILSDKTKFKLFKPHGNVKKEPIIYLEDRTNRQLRSLMDSGQISEDIYNKVRSTGSQLPRLYGLPKCHKRNLILHIDLIYQCAIHMLAI